MNIGGETTWSESVWGRNDLGRIDLGAKSVACIKGRDKTLKLNGGIGN